jgi:hypothetical protein
MRKLAPAFILTSIIALSSGAAFGLGDKAKKSTAADTASTQAATKASDETTKPTDPAKPNPASSAGPSAANSTSTSTSMASTNGATATSEACKGLTPSDAAWKTHNCSADGGSTIAAPTSGEKRSDSLGGAGSSGPGSAGSSGSTQ